MCSRWTGTIHAIPMRAFGWYPLIIDPIGDWPAEAAADRGEAVYNR